MKNILFICKHNLFRSKVAEAYFKKVNQNKGLKASSAGIIKANALSKIEKKIIKLQRKTAKDFGISFNKSSKLLNISLLKKQEMIIIVADDVPGVIFNNKFYLKPNLKVVVWQIPDVKGKKNDKELIIKDIKVIMGKVDKLMEELK